MAKDNQNWVEESIDGFEKFPLTEDQQRLVNYLRANIDDIKEAFAD